MSKRPGLKSWLAGQASSKAGPPKSSKSYLKELAKREAEAARLDALEAAERRLRVAVEEGDIEAFLACLPEVRYQGFDWPAVQAYQCGIQHEKNRVKSNE